MIHGKPRVVTPLKDFLLARDPGLRATRRAVRAAICVPLLLWVGKDLLDSAALGTFAALGSMAMLVFVDFDGRPSDRTIAQATLVLSGAVLICLGTLLSTVIWAATLATLVLTCTVLFAGILSSSLAGATNVLLISFVLPVTLPAPTAAIPDRLLGWLLAGAISVLAIRLLWPAPTREPLRVLAAEACRRFASQLRGEAHCVSEQLNPASLDALRQLREQAADIAGALRNAFFATPYRPAGLSTSSRALVRTTDELIWLDRVFARVPLSEPATANGAVVCELTTVAAELLEHGADLVLAGGAGRRVPVDHETHLIERDLQRLRDAREVLEQETTSGASAEHDSRGATSEADAVGLVSSLQPSFRSQEVSFVVAAIAQNIQLGAAAQQRSWPQRLLGRQPGERDSA
jgi:hypothetical protein